ncbi:MAG: hypothetical protein Tsb0014_47810 [Pleurocapsa sp.]
MTAFLSLGLLERITTFAQKDVSQEKLLNTCYLSDSYEENCYRELIEPLASIGRHDLVNGIEQIIRRYHQRDLKGIVKRIDKAFFNSNLLQIGKKLHNFKKMSVL